MLLRGLIFISLQIMHQYECHQVLPKPKPDQSFPSDQYTLPAPGLRYSAPRTKVRRRQVTPNDNRAEIVGNLLPVDPKTTISEVQTFQVSCQRDQMTVQITFDKPFNGVIYSKGFYNTRACHHIKANSRRRQYIFNVTPGKCGTQYVGNPGQAPYLENVLIIQNTPGIQEVSDTARGVRCLLTENSPLKSKQQKVIANLNVAQMDHKFVTFSADTTSNEAKQPSVSLDIQVGKGPFGPTAAGLVRIGEMMTMVVTVEGEERADVLVRKCIAHDGTQDNEIQLTDQNGCVMKKEIMGSWQKMRSAESTKPVMTYSYFQAFKFPDKLDVFLECEVELCNKECIVCPVDKKSRKKRYLQKREVANNSTKNSEESETSKPNSFRRNGMKLAKRLRVLSPEDLATTSQDISSITLVTKTATSQDEDFCVSLTTLISGLVIMAVVLMASLVVSTVLCIRLKTQPTCAESSPYLPDSSFHAFSSVLGKTLT